MCALFRLARRVTFFLFLVCVPSSVLPGQILGVANGLTGRVHMVSRDLAWSTSTGGMFGVQYVATNGVDRVWATASGPGRVVLWDLGFPPRTLASGSGQPVGVAMTADQGAIVAVTDAANHRGRLDRYDRDGCLAWSVPVEAWPRLIAIGRDGCIWVTHRVAQVVSALHRYDPTGLPLSSSRLPSPATCLTLARDGSIWVACHGSATLVHFGADGKLERTLEERHRFGTLAAAPEGHIVLPRTDASLLELRDAEGLTSTPVPTDPGVTDIAAIGGGRYAFLHWGTGRVSVGTGLAGGNVSAVFGPGVHTAGDLCGMNWAYGVGWNVDADRDGMPNREEIAAGTDPFDSRSRAATCRLDGGHSPGDPASLSFECVGAPGGFYWLGVSDRPVDYAMGVQRMSIGGGAVFDRFQALSWAHWGGPLGFFDLAGCATRSFAMPPVRWPSGISVHVAFLAFPNFPDVDRRIASPAFRVVLR